MLRFFQKIAISLSMLFGFLTAVDHTFAQTQLPAVGYINTVAGDGVRGSSGDDGGVATDAELAPATIGVDSAGNLYIGNVVNISTDCRIVKVTASTGIMTTIAGTGTCGYSGDNGLATNAEIGLPGGIAVDASGNIYFADDGNNRVRKITASTGIITTVAGTGTAGYSGDGGLAVNAEMTQPRDIVLDSAGDIYIAVFGNSRIRKVTASTGIITTVAGNGTPGSSGDGGSALNAEINAVGLAVDGVGNIYIADEAGQRIRKVSAATGIISTIAGNGTGGETGDNGPATNAEIYYPTSVAVDPANNLYIAEFLGQKVRRVNLSTGIITTFAGTGTVGYSGDGGLAVDAKLNYPTTVAVDGTGNVYIADQGNARVRAVGGNLSTLVLYPGYKVTSILYAPPGDLSQAGFSSGTMYATTTTLGNSFQYSSTLTFTEGFGDCKYLCTSVSEAYGVSMGTSDSYAFQESYTSATGVTNQSNSANPDAVNHNQDQFLIWVDPQLTIVSNGSVPATYSIGIQPTADGQTPLPDVLKVTAAVMEANASGNTTVPAPTLNQQYNQETGQYTPGLASICANLITAEYQTNSCTFTDQCGCRPADFLPILQTDPLLFSNGTDNPVSPYPGYVSPLQANSSSGNLSDANCGTIPNPNPSESDCRYVPVPSSIGSTNPLSVPLQGPDCLGCDNGGYPFSQGDNSTTTLTFGSSFGQSVGVTVKTGNNDLSWMDSNTLSWTDSQSVGIANGTTYTMSGNLNSNSVGCDETIDVYEDTVFHTFVFQDENPVNNTLCTSAIAAPTFSPAAGTYGAPQTVTISTSTPGAVIYYTTDGTTPTISSPTYTGPIAVNSNESIQAISYVPGWSPSAVVTASYTIQ